MNKLYIDRDQFTTLREIEAEELLGLVHLGTLDCYAHAMGRIGVLIMKLLLSLPKTR